MDLRCVIANIFIFIALTEGFSLMLIVPAMFLTSPPQVNSVHFCIFSSAFRTGNTKNITCTIKKKALTKIILQIALTVKTETTFDQLRHQPAGVMISIILSFKSGHWSLQLVSLGTSAAPGIDIHLLSDAGAAKRRLTRRILQQLCPSTKSKKLVTGLRHDAASTPWPSSPGWIL